MTKGDGKQRICAVEPMDAIVDVRSLTDNKFPGNPTLSYRSCETLRIVAEVAQWHAFARGRAWWKNFDPRIRKLRPSCFDTTCVRCRTNALSKTGVGQLREDRGDLRFLYIDGLTQGAREVLEGKARALTLLEGSDEWKATSAAYGIQKTNSS